MTSNVWQFPHSPKEFPDKQWAKRYLPLASTHHGIPYTTGAELLRHWIGHELRYGVSDVKRPGQYDIPDAKGHGEKVYQPVVPGDIALFVKDRLLVAGGRVQEGFTQYKPPRMYTPFGGGPGILYVGYITFDPSSLVTFVKFDPPVHQCIIGPGGGDRGFPANKPYRGPQFGRPWKLRPEQHWYIRDLIKLIPRP